MHHKLHHQLTLAAETSLYSVHETPPTKARWRQYAPCQTWGRVMYRRSSRSSERGSHACIVRSHGLAPRIVAAALQCKHIVGLSKEHVLAGENEGRGIVLSVHTSAKKRDSFLIKYSFDVIEICKAEATHDEVTEFSCCETGSGRSPIDRSHMPGEVSINRPWDSIGTPR